MIYDIVIVGAGVIGGMTSHELMKYNLKICILEKKNRGAFGNKKGSLV